MRQLWILLLLTACSPTDNLPSRLTQLRRSVGFTCTMPNMSGQGSCNTQSAHRRARHYSESKSKTHLNGQLHALLAGFHESRHIRQALLKLGSIKLGQQWLLAGITLHKHSYMRTLSTCRHGLVVLWRFCAGRLGLPKGLPGSEPTQST